MRTRSLLPQAGGGPGPRQDFCVAYDATNNLLMLVGEFGPAGGTVHNDAWVLSNANGQGGVPTWTQLAPTGARPPARGGLSATYDPNTNRLTIFGGGDAAGNLMRDAWVLTNANGLGGTPSWSQIAGSSTLFPAHRGQHSAVYDPTSNQMTIFGGHIALTSPISLSNDVWVLGNRTGWSALRCLPDRAKEPLFPRIAHIRVVEPSYPRPSPADPDCEKRFSVALPTDIGLLPVSPDAAEGFFRLVNAAYEKRSVAVNSNLHLAGFDELMPKTLATATVDRLLHHAHVCITSGDSVRLAQATAGKEWCRSAMPHDPLTPTTKEVTRNNQVQRLWAILLAATGQISFHGPHWARS